MRGSERAEGEGEAEALDRFFSDEETSRANLGGDGAGLADCRRTVCMAAHASLARATASVAGSAAAGSPAPAAARATRSAACSRTPTAASRRPSRRDVRAKAIIPAASASGSPGAGAEGDAPRRERGRARRNRARAPRRGADASDTQDIAARAPHRLPRGRRARVVVVAFRRAARDHVAMK